MPVANTKILHDAFYIKVTQGTTYIRDFSSGEIFSRASIGIYTIYFRRIVISTVVILKLLSYNSINLLRTHNKDPPVVFNYLYI